MHQVLKFPIPSDLLGGVTLVMPEGAEVIHVDDQRGALTLWARCPVSYPEPILCKRRFYVVGTGAGFVPPEARHLGTVLLADGDLVLHVFE